jgi:uncharacterized membrane protein YhaH (DUF805 family)
MIIQIIKNLYKGRIGRWRAFSGSLLVAILGLLIIFGSIKLGSQLPFNFNTFFVFLSTVLIIGTYFLTLYITTCIIVRRFHDIGQSGLYSFLLYVPLVGIILGLYVTFKKGEGVENKYGLPPDNSKKFLKDVFNLN